MDFREIKKRRIAEISTVRHFFNNQAMKQLCNFKSDVSPVTTSDIARVACRTARHR